MHAELIKEIVAKRNQISPEELECVMHHMLDEIKRCDKDLYKKIEYKMYRMVYGNHLNEELAKKWVSEMVNKDGSIGEHWSKSQTDQYADNFNKCDWYVAMNMMFSDYFNPKFDIQTYVDLAKDCLNDKDAEDGKLLKYYMFVVCEAL